MKRSALLLTFLLASGGCASTPVAAPLAPAPAPAAPVVEARPSLPPPPYGDAAKLGAWVDAYVGGFGKRWGEANAFSGCLAVAREGKPVFERCYGKADRAKGTVAGPDTRFRIGSLTKQFTAVAILQLAEKELLKLDEPIHTYLPDAPAAWDAITVHHLLTHTSGIPSFTDDKELMKDRGKPHTQAEVVAHFRDKPLDFKPGEGFAYSNSGYFLLGMILEKVSGQSYETYLRAHVLGPAGMDHTSTVEVPDAPDSAVGYTVGPDEEVALAPPSDLSLPFSAGALRSTLNDLMAWDRALTGTTLISEASLKRMTTPAKNDYAYGVARAREEGFEVLRHTGGIDGFSSYLARVPDAGLVVIALGNSDAFDSTQVAEATLRMALGAKKIDPVEERITVTLEPAVAAAVAGEYALAEASRKGLEGKLPKEVLASVLGVSITAEGKRLFLKPVGQSRLQLLRGDDGAFFTKQAGVTITTEKAEKGAKKGAPVRVLTLKQGALELRYERAGVVEAVGKGKVGKKK